MTPPRATTKKPAPKPELTELSVSYSMGTKINIGNYESVDVHLSERRVFDVSKLSEKEADALATSVYKELHEKLGDRVLDEKAEVLGTKRKKGK